MRNACRKNQMPTWGLCPKLVSIEEFSEQSLFREKYIF